MIRDKYRIGAGNIMTYTKPANDQKITPINGSGAVNNNKEKEPAVILHLEEDEEKCS